MRQINSRLAVLALLFVPNLIPSDALADEASQSKPDAAPLSASPAVFATVNGKPILQGEFHSTYVNHLRQKFYHGQVTAEQLAQERKAVTENLVDRVLFLEEVERRGIRPDDDEVGKRVLTYDQRYAGNPNWQKNREAMLPGLREQLAQQSRLARLETSVRDLPEPSIAEVRAFYDAKPNLFTEPEKLRLHVVLLGVDPSSPRATWDAARAEAQLIVKRLKEGADFGEQARMVSSDPSAAAGGDMGYVHVGMLPESLQSKINQFRLGEIQDPVEMLQGIGIFRLDDKLPATLQPFDRVAQRARELLHRERKDKAWQDFVAALRASARVVVLDAPPSVADVSAPAASSTAK
jgi:hypothetical protein